MISVCKRCSNLINVTSDEVRIVAYDIARPDLLAMTARESVPEYIPFWKFEVNIEVNIEVTDKLTGGETATGLPDITGRRSCYICAGDVPRYLAEQWEIDLTILNPEVVDQQVELKPIVINQVTARELTEFFVSALRGGEAGGFAGAPL